jgi:hypothetical protein
MGDSKWRAKKLGNHMNVERLNINVGGKRSPGFVGNDKDFEQIDALIGAQLPKDYIIFIKAADGGHPEVGSFFLDGDREHNSFSVDWFYTFSNPNVENIKTAISQWGKLLGRKMLPIARDGGGNQFYLNLTDVVPTVWIYLHDNNERIKLADSFVEFLSALTDNPDFI